MSKKQIDVEVKQKKVGEVRLKEVMKITGIGVDYAFDAIGKEEVQALNICILIVN